MEFKLNLETDRRPLVHTDASALNRAMVLGNRARGAYGRAQAAYGGKAASAFEAAKIRAREAGRNNIAKVRAFKARWGGWLQKQNTNFWLLISNVLYIAVSLTALILTLLIMNEHVGDFRRNEFTQHVDQADGSVAQYRPCGMPTPDAMYLMQAIGALPAAGWDGASLEPNYKKWMQSVDRALCSRIVPGKDLPMYDADLNQCLATNLDNDYGIEYTEELLAFGYLMDDDTVTPTQGDDTAAVAEKNSNFEHRACLEKKQKATATTPELKPFYAKQQRDAYGDLKTRVARAYIAAMPAFARYLQERDGCQAGADFVDPFDSMCKHSCHIRKELYHAALDQHAMYDTGIDSLPQTTTFSKQLYRLLALSLAGYYDRYHNQGTCFENKKLTAADGAAADEIGKRDTAMNFCGDSMRSYAAVGGTDPGIVTTYDTKNAVAQYTTQNEKIENDEQCGTSGDGGAHPPPSPAPPIFRNAPEDGSDGLNDQLASQVCAATLQYGLFEQGRLFGIPDVIAPFVVDNRVDRGLHFIGQVDLRRDVRQPRQEGRRHPDRPQVQAGDVHRLPPLEHVHLGHPGGQRRGVHADPRRRPSGGVAAEVLRDQEQREADVGRAHGRVRAHRLVRPQFGWPLYLAQAPTCWSSTGSSGSTPPRSRTTTSRPSATTGPAWACTCRRAPTSRLWGKRRFGRFGEHIIGILLVFTFLFVLFQMGIGKSLVDPDAGEEGDQGGWGTTKRLDYVALVMIGLALVVQILFISQSIVSGDDWYQAIKASANDHDMLVTFSKDVLMSVWAAFWTSASIAWYRQKWAVDKLPKSFQYAWMAAAWCCCGCRCSTRRRTCPTRSTWRSQTARAPRTRPGSSSTS